MEGDRQTEKEKRICSGGLQVKVNLSLDMNSLTFRPSLETLDKTMSGFKAE